MKKLIYIIISLFAITGCTDNFEEINKNPNKLYQVEFNYVFPGVVYRSMNNLGELNYSYLMTYSRYVVLQAFCGARQDEGDGYYNRFYVGILKDLESAIKEYEGKKGFENRLAVVKTWKAYTYYIMASMYGGVAMSDALLTYETKIEYSYDTEEQVYTQILALLDEAVALYNPDTQFKTTDIISPDPVFGVNSTPKWRKFANSMMLNIALHAQNLNMSLAKTYVEKAMKNEDWLIASGDENVTPRWGTNINADVSFYYDRIWRGIDAGQSQFEQTLYPAMGEYFATYLFSFKDPRMQEYFETSNFRAGTSDRPYLFSDTITRPHICDRVGTNRCEFYNAHQADGLNPYRRDSITAQYSVPYVPMSELPYMAFNWEAELVSVTGTERYSDPLLSMSSRYNPSYIKKEFVDRAAPLPILSFADVCFMKAEASILFGVGKKSAEEYYNDGIRASFTQYNILAKAAAYMQQDGVKWNTSKTGFGDRRGLYTAQINGQGGNENHLEQIYKQRYFAGYLNFLEAWNLERRTRSLRFPPFLASGTSSSVEGVNSTYNYSMERFIYPRNEMSQNNTQYQKALENLKAVSPFYRNDRWGDNIFTSLGFSRKNPDLDTAEGKYVGNKRIIFNAAYLSHPYGLTYEEVLAKAKEMTGDTNETRALMMAFSYSRSNEKFLRTYLTIDLTEK